MEYDALERKKTEDSVSVSRTAEKIVFAGRCQTMYVVSLVHICKFVSSQILKILYANRVQHILANFCNV